MGISQKDMMVAILVGIIFIFLFCSLMIMVVVNFVRRKRKILLEKQEREANFNQELLQSQVEMQESTLKTISQEIHDNVGQVLSLAKLNISILAMKDPANGKLLEIKDLVGKAIVDLRALSTGYYGENLLETGFIKAIKREVHHLERTGLFTISFDSAVTEIDLEKNKAIFLYRMIQEILNNIVKHSAAKNINLTIFQQGGKKHIKIVDDGKGFDQNDPQFKAGLGLNNMQQRAAMIEAQIIIKSILHKGTSVELIF
jgi:signal transduction histidine kinase